MAAIELAIPKDIRDYETKIIGNFTLRTLLCTGGAVITGFGARMAQIAIIGEEVSTLPIALAAALPLSFVFKPYGIRMERFLKKMFIERYIAPKCRIYKQENPLKKFISTKDLSDIEEEILTLKQVSYDDIINKKERSKLEKQRKKELGELQKKLKKSQIVEKKSAIPKELTSYL